MILGMLPTWLQQDEGLSNEKQIFFHSWERELFHYGNYCNHEGGKPVCTHNNTTNQAHPLKEITAWVGMIHRLSLHKSQYGGFILIITERARTHRSICILKCSLHPSGRQIHSTQLFYTSQLSPTIQQVNNLFLYEPYGCVGGDAVFTVCYCDQY